jgi:hypothetical protein
MAALGWRLFRLDRREQDTRPSYVHDVISRADRAEGRIEAQQSELEQRLRYYQQRFGQHDASHHSH